MPTPRLPLALLLAAALAPAVLAQPARDEAGVAAAFARIVALAHAGDVEAALPSLVCPVRDAAGAVAIGRCDPARIEHRARAEWQLALVHHLFPEEATALRPNYTVAVEDGVGFHLLLFSDLPTTPFALVIFTDVEGEHRFAEVQVRGELADVPPPASVVAAFEAVLAAAGDGAVTAEAFAPLVVARGEDPARAWQAPADPARADERAFVEATLSDLRRLTAGADGYAITGFDIEYEEEGAWHVLLVHFDGAEAPMAFAFLPVGGAFPSGSSRFLLGDVDG